MKFNMQVLKQLINNGKLSQLKVKFYLGSYVYVHDATNKYVLRIRDKGNCVTVDKLRDDGYLSHVTSIRGKAYKLLVDYHNLPKNTLQRSRE